MVGNEIRRRAGLGLPSPACDYEANAMTKKTPGIKKTNVPHMFRVNYPQHGQVGYVVRLQRLDKRFYEIFNFSQFPTQAVCRKAAEKRAKELGAKYPLLSRRERAERRIKKSSSASVPGVRRIVKRHGDREYPFWEALWWPKPGVVMKKSFSIFKYGAKEARKLAIEARLAGIKSMKD